MMNDPIVVAWVAIISASGLGILAGIQRFWEWFVPTVLKKQTAKQRVSAETTQSVMKIISLATAPHNAKIDVVLKKIDYKEVCRSLVRRTAELIVLRQQQIARQIIESEECCTADDVDRSLHIFLSASESLKPVVVEIFMCSVELNGFVKKSPSEWMALLNELNSDILSKSAGHYQSWYKHGHVSYKSIMDALQDDRDELANKVAIVMNALRQEASFLDTAEKRAEKVSADSDKEIQKLIEGLNNPKRR